MSANRLARRGAQRILVVTRIFPWPATTGRGSKSTPFSKPATCSTFPFDTVPVVGNGPVLSRATSRSPRPDLKQGRRFLVCWVGLMGPQDHVDLTLHAVDHLSRVGRTRVEEQLAWDRQREAYLDVYARLFSSASATASDAGPACGPATTPGRGRRS
jgi:hypothetical protein